MVEYIDREAAVKIAEKYGLANGSVLGRHTGMADCIASEIAALPAADVVPVVHCKDCKHYDMGVCLKIYSDGNVHSAAWQSRNPDDYCSYGERKDGDADNG